MRADGYAHLIADGSAPFLFCDPFASFQDHPMTKPFFLPIQYPQALRPRTNLVGRHHSSIAYPFRMRRHPHIVRVHVSVGHRPVVGRNHLRHHTGMTPDRGVDGLHSLLLCSLLCSAAPVSVSFAMTVRPSTFRLGSAAAHFAAY